MPSAIVTGATGILGREIVFELGQHPQQWPTVHALSRSKKDKYPENVVHNYVDLTTSADEMAKQLEKVEAEYIFFAAYLQKDSEQENWDVNGDMLENFLKALDKTGASKSIKRIILVGCCLLRLGVENVKLRADNCKPLGYQFEAYHACKACIFQYLAVRRSCISVCLMYMKKVVLDKRSQSSEQMLPVE